MTGTTPVRAINGTTVEACRPKRGVTRKSSDTIGGPPGRNAFAQPAQVWADATAASATDNTMTPICRLRIWLLHGVSRRPAGAG